MTDPATPEDSAPQPQVSAAVAAPLAGLPQQPRCIRSEEILQGKTEVLILHQGSIYRLRHTKSGKLILNK